ncbi:MAG: mechanosensitive ion channel family protein [Mucilaginibacter polytrichastri]|nr:mechanosensitive ion channel family protein [Mucilaginibacter polytrichastri]
MNINVDKVWDKVFDWIIVHGPPILGAIVVLLVGLWLVRFLKKLLRRVFHVRAIDQSLQDFFVSLITTALYILLVMLVISIVGINISIFAALIAAMGVAAGLALSGTLQNFAGGVLILLLKPFKVDDNIIAQGYDGKVTSIQLFYTKVTLFDNRQVVIPNGKLSNEVILNVTKLGTRRMEIAITLSYYTDIDQAREAIADAIKNTDNILADPAPRIAVHKLEDNGMVFTIRTWVPSDVHLSTKFALNEAIVKHLRAANVMQPVDDDFYVLLKKEQQEQA